LYPAKSVSLFNVQLRVALPVPGTAAGDGADGARAGGVDEDEEDEDEDEGEDEDCVVPGDGAGEDGGEETETVGATS
jgi:hypothetical protein